MTKLHDAYTQAAEREIEHWPGATLRFEKSAKHRRAIVAFGDRERFIVFPTSPSDSSRGHLNFLTDFRVELRALGARRVERTPSTERRKRNVAAPRQASLPEISDPRPDGFAQLRELHAKLSAAAEPAIKPRRSIWASISQMFQGRAA